jgi:hypothetical protein
VLGRSQQSDPLAHFSGRGPVPARRHAARKLRVGRARDFNDAGRTDDGDWRPPSRHRPPSVLGASAVNAFACKPRLVLGEPSPTAVRRRKASAEAGDPDFRAGPDQGPAGRDQGRGPDSEASPRGPREDPTDAAATPRPATSVRGVPPRPPAEERGWL